MTDSVRPVYIAEFIDGPLQGSSETRLLVAGKYDRRFGAMAAVGGLESVFWYNAVNEREIEGELHIHYSFKSAESDPVQGEPDEESIQYP
jgi:hypothetical protein